MEYKDIEVGKTYLHEGKNVDVLFKHDFTEQVVTIDREGFIEPLKKEEFESWPLEYELPENEVLVLEGREDVVVYRTVSNKGFGFIEGRFISLSDNIWNFNENPHRWKTSTLDERMKFRQLLIEEAEKRGIIKGVKVKCLHYKESFVLGSPVSSRHYVDNGGLWFKDILGSRHVKVMHEGVWAELIKNKKTVNYED
jgi:hypothetical protein